MLFLNSTPLTVSSKEAHLHPLLLSGNIMCPSKAPWLATDNMVLNSLQKGNNNRLRWSKYNLSLRGLSNRRRGQIFRTSQPCSKCAHNMAIFCLKCEVFPNRKYSSIVSEYPWGVYHISSSKPCLSLSRLLSTSVGFSLASVLSNWDALVSSSFSICVRQRPQCLHVFSTLPDTSYGRNQNSSSSVERSFDM